ncbi:hypothetical protein AQUCO_01700154v1, partial [Aquilegia coerulea]
RISSRRRRRTITPRIQILTTRVRQRFSTVASEGIGSKLLKGVSEGKHGIEKQVEEKVVKTSSETSGAWVPDPVIGYYRPENKANVIDPAELRNVLLKRRHH